MQLTNILRDIAEDAGRNRVYLPADMLVRHGIESNDAHEILHAVSGAQMLDDLARLADGWYAEAAAILETVPGARARAPRVMMAGYRHLLLKLRRRGWDALEMPVHIGTVEKLWIVARHGLIGGFGHG